MIDDDREAAPDDEEDPRDALSARKDAPGQEDPAGGPVPPGEEEARAEDGVEDEEDDPSGAFDDAGKGANGKANWRGHLPTEAMAQASPLGIIQPEQLQALARLRRENPAAFYALAQRLVAVAKNKLITVSKLEDLIRPIETDQRRQARKDEVEAEDEKETKNATKLLMQLANHIPLTLTRDGNVVFADVLINGHAETWRVEGKRFAQHLRYQYTKKTDLPPPAEALNAVIQSLIATAMQEARRLDIDLRTVSYIDPEVGRVLLHDLGDDTWQYVRITHYGWEVCQRTPTNTDPSGMGGAPVRFRRSPHTSALPAPARGSSLIELAPFLGIRRADALKNSTYLLGVSWVLTAILPVGVYLHLLINGEPGAFKSSIARALTGVIDPHSLKERLLPKNEQDLAIAAFNSALPLFDNSMEPIPREIVPAFCLASTGGAHATRTLYSNDEETVIEFKRPCTVVGTPELAIATELAERAIQLPLDKHAGKIFAPDAVDAIWARELPGILGALYDVLAGGLEQEAIRTGGKLSITDPYQGVVMSDADIGGEGMSDSVAEAQGRMEGAIQWVEDSELALGWKPGTFRRLYRENLELGAERVASASELATALQRFMVSGHTDIEVQGDVRTWQGTASDLLDRLTAQVGAQAARGKSWPKHTNTLTQRLCTEMKPTLKKLGIVVARGQRSAGQRPLAVTYTAEETPEPPTDTAGSSSSSSTAAATPEPAEMQSGTVENETASSDGHTGRSSEDPQDRHCLVDGVNVADDDLQDRHTPSRSSVTPKKPRVSASFVAKEHPDDDGDDLSLPSAGSGDFSLPVSPTTTKPGNGQDPPAASPAQPPVEKPSGKPVRRRIKSALVSRPDGAAEDAS